MRRIFAAVVGILVLAGTGRGADEITIKFKKPGVGDISKDTKDESEDTTVIISVMGMDQKKQDATKSRFVFTDEILEKPGDTKRPTKIKRTYETAERTKGGAAIDLGLTGKTVLIEKKGEKYEFKFADGTAVGPAATELLDKEINKKSDTTGDEIFLPKKPVKVGDSWPVDLAVGAKDLEDGGLSIDKEKSKGTVTLNKVYDKAGAKYGVMAIKMDLVVTKASGGGMDIPMKEGSKLTFEGTIDACIDGTTSAGEMKVKITGDMSAEVMGAALKFDIQGTKTGKSEAVKAK